MKFTLIGFFFPANGRINLFPAHVVPSYPFAAGYKDEAFSYLRGVSRDLPHSVADRLEHSRLPSCFVSVLDGQLGEKGCQQPKGISAWGARGGCSQ